VQAEILDVLRELQARLGIAYLFIAHDLAVVRWLARRVLVLYGGHVLEAGPAAETFAPPVHPYTEMLLTAVPEPGVVRLLPAERREMAEPPESKSGCPFAPLCPRRVGPICDLELPPWQNATPAHTIRCHIEPPVLASMQHFPWLEVPPADRETAGVP
jgi:peptide/nickel transport system ATP-binding protein